MAGNDDDEKILTGNIRLSSFMNSDYDEYSQMDNQVYEVQGDLSLPVWGIPVRVSGFYTSQDKNRMAKSGYFNIKYDHDKAKEKTAKMIQGFREAFQQNKDRVSNYRMTYDGYIGNMESEKKTEWHSSWGRRWG
ncbi:MAG: hypothetical protein KL787_05610 [Taibaiella sp.]|nr:hypothetical protein [Taibaiella sp.]